MAHFFVTGANGFIGTHLVARLCAAGHEVTGLVRPGRHVAPLVANGARIAQGEIADRQSACRAVRAAGLSGDDLVIHLAGRTRAFSYRHFAEVNAVGTENVAQACLELESPPTLIAVSSLAAGGPSAPGIPRTEADPDAPVSNYGRSKLAGDESLYPLADRLPVSIVRPSIVFGDGDVDNLPMFKTIKRTGLHIVPRRGEKFPLSLIHVDDLVTACVLVAERGRRLRTGDASRPGVYYVADPEPASYAQMGRWAAAAMNRPARLFGIRRGWLYLPALGGELVGRITRRPAQFTLDKVREATAPAWVCSTGRLQQETGFQPAASLAVRMQATADWYRNQGWL